MRTDIVNDREIYNSRVLYSLLSTLCFSFSTPVQRLLDLALRSFFSFDQTLFSNPESVLASGGIRRKRGSASIGSIPET